MAGATSSSSFARTNFAIHKKGGRAVLAVPDPAAHREGAMFRHCKRERVMRIYENKLHGNDGGEIWFIESSNAISIFAFYSNFVSARVAFLSVWPFRLFFPRSLWLMTEMADRPIRLSGNVFARSNFDTCNESRETVKLVFGKNQHDFA